MTSLNFSNVQINNFLGPVNLNSQNDLFSGGYDYQFSCNPCEDYSSNLDLMFNGCDSGYSSDPILTSLAQYMDGVFSALATFMENLFQPSQPSQPTSVDQPQNGSFEQFMNEMMAMIMEMLNPQQPCPQPEPQPEPYVPSDPAVVNPQPQTFNLEYNDTDYAVQFEDGRFTTQVGGVDLELTLADNGHVQTVFDDQLIDLGLAKEDGDGTFSIDESTAAPPVASKVADYKLNYDGVDYVVTQHVNGTFTAQVGDEDFPIAVKDDGTLVVTANGDNVEIGKVKEDGDGTFSVEH